MEKKVRPKSFKSSVVLRMPFKPFALNSKIFCYSVQILYTYIFYSSTAIPKGTLLAIVVTFCTYIGYGTMIGKATMQVHEIFIARNKLNYLFFLQTTKIS